MLQDEARMTPRASDLERARAAYAERSWLAAHEGFVGADRTLKRLSLITAGEVCEPVIVQADAPMVPGSATLRDVLAILLARGADNVRVTDAEGATLGGLTLAAVRKLAVTVEPRESVA